MAQTITFRSTSSPPESSSAPLAAEATVSVTAGAMGASAGNLGEVSYQSDREKRVFLLPTDIASEVTFGGGEGLELPIQATDFGTTTVIVPPLDSPKFMSARIYDTGMCSQFADWDTFGPTILTGLFREVAGAKYLTGNGESGKIFTAPDRGTSTLQPVFRASNVTSDEDTIHVHIPFTTAELTAAYPNGSTGSCTNLSITIDFELGVRRVQGYSRLPPRCLGSEASSTYPVAGAFDFLGVLRVPLRVTTEFLPGGGRCSAGMGLGRDPLLAVSVPVTLEESLTALLPFAVTQVLNDALLRPAALFGLMPRPCTCDIECTELASSIFGPISNPYGTGSGLRHRCITTPGPGNGTCGVQLEADRIALRPDGIEIVLAEDDSDLQVATVLQHADAIPEIEALCTLGRSTTPLDPLTLDYVEPGRPSLHFEFPFVSVP